jgi:asparagine synthase (glutamine-hydrolysing)
MCGIAGELSFSKPVDAGHIKRMMAAIFHRGPDDEGLFCDGRIGLGHRRLSIIDLTESGRNPIWTADRSMAIILNGEIYNYRELRAQLQGLGYSFTSETDTEVVLNAIHCWGIEQALRKFIGMFAFAVWNARERCLILARDRAGIKPLFYSKTSDSLLFGSELKALYAHPGYQKRLDRRGLGQYFVLGYTLGEATVLADTFRVPAGHFLRAGIDGSLNLQRYWGLDGIQRGSFAGSFDEAVEEMERLAESAFAYRLVSDVPVGVFLSGGIDSTFLAAILKKRIGADLLHITIGFRDARYDEAPIATQIAAELGIRHEVRYIDAQDAVNALRRFSEIYDEPFGDSSGMPTAMLSAVAREYVKVALSADGGDEQFCGYESYPDYANRYRQLSRIPMPLRRAAAKALAALPYERLLSLHVARQGVSRKNPRLISTIEKAFEIMRAGTPSDLIRIMNEKGWSERKVGALLGEDLSGFFADSVFASRLVGADSADSAQMMDAMMRSDYQSFLRDDILTKVDRASMAVSLECRDPFLDHRFAEFAYSLPMEYVYSNGEHKRILKHILRRWISEPILKIPKRGFVVPLYEWMRSPWKPLVREYLSRERIRTVGVLDENVVASQVDRFYRYEGVGAEKLLLLLNFQMWAERWYCA